MAFVDGDTILVASTFVESGGLAAVAEGTLNPLFGIYVVPPAAAAQVIWNNGKSEDSPVDTAYRKVQAGSNAADVGKRVSVNGLGNPYSGTIVGSVAVEVADTGGVAALAQMYLISSPRGLYLMYPAAVTIKD